MLPCRRSGSGMTLSLYAEIFYNRLKEITSRRHWWLVIAAVFAVVILINGVGLVPPRHYQQLAENPFVTRHDISIDNYWQENILLPLIAYATGLNTPAAFHILCFMIITAACVLFAWLTWRRSGVVASVVFTTLVITGPVMTVLLSWLGTPDGLTVLLTIPFLFSGSGVLMFLLALLGTTNHVVMFVAGFEVLLLRWAARDSVTLRHLVVTAAGGGAGYGLTRLFLAVNRIDVYSRLDYILQRDVRHWFEVAFTHFPLTLFSLFNFQWVLVLVCLAGFYRASKRVFWSGLGVLLFNGALTFFMDDTTRVFSLLSWGILAVFLQHAVTLAGEDSDFSPGGFLQTAALVGVVSVISPRFYAWSGDIHTTPFFDSLRWVYRFMRHR